MLIITADHGEELFEDQRCGHGGSLRDSLTRVPLLIHDPARFPADMVVDEGAEGVDLMPTVLDRARRRRRDAGRPAGRAARAARAGRRSRLGPAVVRLAVRVRRTRCGSAGGRSASWPRGTPLVGDMAADPGEKVDATAGHPIERRMLTDNLGLFLAIRTQWRKAEWGVVTSVTPAGALALDGVSTP